MRHAGLIRKLVEEAGAVALTGPDLVAYLRGVVAARLGREASGVDTRTGFHELGLDSTEMLQLSADLETLVGARLYPTLLFEHSTVDSLAAHLGEHYSITLPPSPAGPTDTALPVVGLPATRPTATWPTDTSPPATSGPADAVVACLQVFRPTWTAAPSRSDRADVGTILLVAVQDDIAVALAGRGRVVRVPPDRDAVVGALVGEDDLTSVVVGLPPDPLDAFATCAAVAAALAEHGGRRERRVLFVHRVMDNRDEPGAAAAAAFAHTVTAETPWLRCRAVGVDQAGDVGEAVLAELRDGGEDTDLRHAGGRFARRLAPGAPAGTPLTLGAACLVTGATGGIGALVAEHLARRYQARLVLSGRGPVPEALVERCRALGSETVYLRADVTAQADVAALVAHARDRFGTIDAVFHCAGVVRDGLHFRKRFADSAAVLATKVTGTLHLDAATADLRPRMVLFSSLSSMIPSPGQADYAFGNAFLNS
ncbi:SDR family NAD(P)-dependent oxidoreductase, partial [Frankia sp. CcWB2]